MHWSIAKASKSLIKTMLSGEGLGEWATDRARADRGGQRRGQGGAGGRRRGAECRVGRVEGGVGRGAVRGEAAEVEGTPFVHVPPAVVP